MLPSLSNKSKSIILSLPIIDVDWISDSTKMENQYCLSQSLPSGIILHQFQSYTILTIYELGSILMLSSHLPFHHSSSCFQGIPKQIMCVFCLPQLNWCNLKFWYHNTRWSRKLLSSLLFKYPNMPVSLILCANSFWSNLVLDIPPSH
jgi:hypothetical protein